jgi:hypothetical protein
MHEVQNYRAKSALNIQRNENGRENEMLAPHGQVDSLAVLRLRMVGGSTVSTELDISCIDTRENGANGGTDVTLREKTVPKGLSH